ncbi:MAG: hypothetical protein GY861_17255 [bacterium]|nr:hypothetical protein [bacterium]
MGLELDRLEKQNGYCVILNNTTDEVAVFSIDYEDFISVLSERFDVSEEEAHEEFNREEIESFFCENDIDITEEERNKFKEA